MLSLVRPFVYSFPMMKVARLKKTIAVRGRGPHCRRAVHVTYSSLACLQCRSLSRVQLEAEFARVNAECNPLDSKDVANPLSPIYSRSVPARSSCAPCSLASPQPRHYARQVIQSTVRLAQSTATPRWLHPHQWRRGQIAIEPSALLLLHLTRFLPLALFVRLRSARVDGVVVQASEKLHTSRHRPAEYRHVVEEGLTCLRMRAASERIIIRLQSHAPCAPCSECCAATSQGRGRSGSAPPPIPGMRSTNQRNGAWCQGSG